MNADGEPKGRTCPRQTAGGLEVFLWVLFQIGVCSEAEVISERVPPQAFFTDVHSHTTTATHNHSHTHTATHSRRHTHAALHRTVHLQDSIMMCKRSILRYLFRAIMRCNEASFFSPTPTLTNTTEKVNISCRRDIDDGAFNCGSCTVTACM